MGARGRDVLKALPGPCQDGGSARHGLESSDDHIAVSWIIFDQAGKPPRLLGGDQGRPRTAERIKHDIAAATSVLDRIGYEIRWLDGWVEFQLLQTSWSKSIDAGIVPNIGPVSTRLTETECVHVW